ncbi:MAG: 2,3-diphosphoglycerate synthetase, partial [Acidimicrobiia bacterium]
MREQSIVVIDGEHYPPVIKRAIDRLFERGENPVIALLVGGGEKLDQVPLEIGVPVTTAIDKRETALAEAIDETGAKKVIDLSDEPVLGYVDRCRLASVALWKGAAYVGSDFAFEPPDRSIRPSVATLAVIGTGKRTGKTAIASEVARMLSSDGLDPVIVAMGRGGPEDPE